jgi:hypothetical protein
VLQVDQVAAVVEETQPAVPQALQTKETLAGHHRIHQMRFRIKAVAVAGLVRLGLPAPVQLVAMEVLGIQKVQQYMIGNLVVVL